MASNKGPPGLNVPNLFEDPKELEKLHTQATQLSPRRQFANGGQESSLKILPFYENITASDALNRLFDWFHVEVEEDCIDSTDVQQEEQKDEEKKEQSGEEKGSDVESDEEEEDTSQNYNSATKAEVKETGMTLDEFNYLRLCIGKRVIEPTEWKRALDELGKDTESENKKEHTVMRNEFKALFGPIPFFGSKKISGIRDEIARAEEIIHFSAILFDRFAKNDNGNKTMTLERLNIIQAKSHSKKTNNWSEVISQLNKENPNNPVINNELDWLQFTHAFHLKINSETLFSPHMHPNEVVNAVMAEKTISEHFSDVSTGLISRTSMQNLMKVKDQPVDVDKWQSILESSQPIYRHGNSNEDTTYKTLRDKKGQTSNSYTDVVIHNTKNHVLAYEVTFNEPGEIGLLFQSDFYGQCSSISNISGQALKHNIIQLHDILAYVDGESVIYDSMVSNEEEENKRLNHLYDHLGGCENRKLIFYRQDVYFQCMPKEKKLRIIFKALKIMPQGSEITIKLPSSSEWGPGSESLDIEASFESPSHKDLLDIETLWDHEENSVILKLPDTVKISAQINVIVLLRNIYCGDQNFAGPGEFYQINGGLNNSISLFKNWDHWKVAITEDQTINEVKSSTESVDESLKPFSFEFKPGDSGITLNSDFFGQCVSVKDVAQFSQAEIYGIKPNDILATISYLQNNNLNVVKPFSLNDKQAKDHFDFVQSSLTDCHKSGIPYSLQFYRINSYYYYQDEKITFAFQSVIELDENNVLMIEMPNSDWHAIGVPSARFLSPLDISAKKTFWNSTNHTLNVTLDKNTIYKGTQVILEISGIKLTGLGRFAGPAEITSIFEVDKAYSSSSYLKFELHDSWHSYMGGLGGIEVDKLAETLKQFETTPADLWEILEYTNLLFCMFVSPGEDYMQMDDLNCMISSVCGDGKDFLGTDEWTNLCITLGAKPLVGLSKREFACCWRNVVGLSTHDVKEVYVRLHTAEMLYDTVIDCFQDNQFSVLKKPGLKCLLRSAGLPLAKLDTLIQFLGGNETSGWSKTDFFKIFAEMKPKTEKSIFRRQVITEKLMDPLRIWTNIHYAKLLFAEFHRRNSIKKEHFKQILKAAKITTIVLTDTKWSSLCKSVGCDDVNGLNLSGFIQAYPSELLECRDALGDWNRIETFKLLPDPKKPKEEDSSAKTAVGKIDVTAAAEAALNAAPSTDDILQDAIAKQMEFSPGDHVVEEKGENIFSCTAKSAEISRSKGTLLLKVKAITEIPEPEGVDQLYVMIFTANESQIKVKKEAPKNIKGCQRLMNLLLGTKVIDTSYKPQYFERHDDGNCQTILHELMDAEKVLQKARIGSVEHTNASHNIDMLKEKLNPFVNDQLDIKKVVFSELRHRSPSCVNLVEFEEDLFRLSIDLDKYVIIPNTPLPKEKKSLFKSKSKSATDEASETNITDVQVKEGEPQQTHIVIKLFSKASSGLGQLYSDFMIAQRAFQRANETSKILKMLIDVQENHLIHDIALMQNEKEHSDADKDMIANAAANLKKKCEELKDYENRVLAAKEKKDEKEKLYNEAKEKGQDSGKSVTENGITSPEKDEQSGGLTTESNTNENDPSEDSTLVNSNDQTENRPPEDQEESSVEKDSLETSTAGKDIEQSDNQSAEIQEVSAVGDSNGLISRARKKLKKKVNTVFEEESIKFIGECIFELSELLTVLRSDDDVADDVVNMYNEYNEHSGKALFEFRFKTDYQSSKEKDLNVLLNETKEIEDGNGNCRTVEECIYQYPSKTNLALVWSVASSELQYKDKISLVREGDSLDKSFFTTYWDYKDDGTLDWSIPDALHDLYSQDPGKKCIVTKKSKIEGVLRFPSAIDLSLPPGSFRYHLIRNYEDKVGQKVRSILGSSAALAIVPGLGGNHTMFGTTPLIDVKTISCSIKYEKTMRKKNTENQKILELTEKWNSNPKFKLLSVAHDVESLKDKISELNVQLLHDDTSEEDKVDLMKEMEVLKSSLQELEIQEMELAKGFNDKSKSLITVTDIEESRNNCEPAENDEDEEILNTSSVFFRVVLLGGPPSPQDRIIIMPAPVLAMSDMLRLKLLGQLQANDSMKVKEMKENILKNLAQAWKLNSKDIINHGRKVASGDAGDMDSTENVLAKDFMECATTVKQFFPDVIRYLLEEIGERKEEFGFTMTTEGQEALSRLNSFTEMMSKTIEISVPTDDYKSLGNNDYEMLVPTVLGPKARTGGKFIARYVRKSKASSDSEKETIGELGRTLAFTVAKNRLWYDYFLELSTAKKEFLIRIGLKLFVAFLKFIFSIIGLGFNVILVGEAFSGLNLSVDISGIEKAFADALNSFGFIAIIISAITQWFQDTLRNLMTDLNIFNVFGGCGAGFALFAIFLVLFQITVFVYMIIQTDLLAKVQKFYTYLPIELSQITREILDELGAAFMLPLYLGVKMCVLFIARQWKQFFKTLSKHGAWEDNFNLSKECSIYSVDYVMLVLAIIALVFFLGFFFPLLVLDLFSWRLPQYLDKERFEYARSGDSKKIRLAVKNNMSLVQFNNNCSMKCLQSKKLELSLKKLDTSSFSSLVLEYGILGSGFLYVRKYYRLVFAAMSRSATTLFGWRSTRSYMECRSFRNSTSRYFFCNNGGIRYNLLWKWYWVSEKVVSPFVRVVLVTFGFWTEKIFSILYISDRANACFLMEPSAEVKQIQLMSIHGKINSLFWLPFPVAPILAYISEASNRAPILSYLINAKFRQAEVPDIDKTPEGKWKIIRPEALVDRKPGIVYMFYDTAFIPTFVKWGSSAIEICMVLFLSFASAESAKIMATIALLSTLPVALLDYVQQYLSAYAEFIEIFENEQELLEQVSEVVMDDEDEDDEEGDDGNDEQKEKENSKKDLKKIKNKDSNKEIEMKNVASNENTKANNQETKNDATTSSKITAKESALSKDDIARNSEYQKALDQIAEEENEDEDTEKKKKSLILLSALPKSSTIIQADALDVGEGLITVSWRVNARKRFHQLDAIGMFPVRKSGDLMKPRTMDECICYRHVVENKVEDFGWSPDDDSEDAQQMQMLSHAKALRTLTEQKLDEKRQSLQVQVSLNSVELKDELEQEAKLKELEDERINKARTVYDTTFKSDELKPLSKDIHKILEEEIADEGSKKKKNVRRLTAIASDKTTNQEKVLNGQVQFRPANTLADVDSDVFERYYRCNDAGIYAAKYGTEDYEFRYLRFHEKKGRKETKGNSENSSKAIILSDSRSKDVVDTEGFYEVVAGFCSNSVSVGTFNIYMTLSCDCPMVGTDRVINLSWVIYGVDFAVLSHPKNTNCIAFYKSDNLEEDAKFSKIEMIPSSAYLPADENEPCPGRMVLKAPKEPGMYEIRFLFNYFKESKLHRQCQVFGKLEDAMQTERILRLREATFINYELKIAAQNESDLWNFAQIHTREWLKPMLIALVDLRISAGVMQSNVKYAGKLASKLKVCLEQAPYNNSDVIQERLRQMLLPSTTAGFMNALVKILSKNSQLNAMVSTISFSDPNPQMPEYDDIPHDKELVKYGRSGLKSLALLYLETKADPSKFHGNCADILDDIILSQGQLLTTSDMFMETISAACVSLYEVGIDLAIQDMINAAKVKKIENFMKGKVENTIRDLCRSHIQVLFRSSLETDVKTGKRFTGWTDVGKLKLVKPLVRQHEALRFWIKPRLVKSIMENMRRRLAKKYQNVFFAIKKALPCGKKEVPIRYKTRFADLNAYRPKSVSWFYMQRHEELAAIAPNVLDKTSSMRTIDVEEKTDSTDDSEEKKEDSGV